MKSKIKCKERNCNEYNPFAVRNCLLARNGDSFILNCKPTPPMEKIIELSEKEYNSIIKKWISVKKELPSSENGFIDEDVLIRVKNKNKENGIFLYDVCSFDGESWGERLHTWENILDWKPIS